MSYSEYLLSSSTQKLIRLASQLAQEYAHEQYGPAHLLWALCDADLGLDGVFRQMGKDAGDIRRWSLQHMDKFPKSARYVAAPAANESAAAVLRETQKLCLRYGIQEVGPVEVLEALVTPDVGFPGDALRRLPLALYELLEWRSKVPSGSGHSQQSMTLNQGSVVSGQGTVDMGVLLKYCDDLTHAAREGKIDPLVGRDSELKQLVEILGKRLSPNVLITGDPGVGKTAIVGGLAQRIISGDVPERLRNATIFELDVSGRLVAGAYKGEVEERLKAIIKAIQAFENKAILFIDEVHVLLDERGSVGSGVVNLLKPELARGELTVIGATSQAEYQKYVEKDTAFNRRFSRLNIAEPDEDLAVTMIRGLIPKYESFHELKVQDQAIQQAVKLAKRYVGDKHLPVSAIELLDFSMACAVQMNSSSTRILEEVEQTWQTAKDQNSPAEIYAQVKGRLSELLLGKMGDAPVTRPGQLQEALDSLKKLTAEPKTEILAEDIEAMIAYRTGIPLGRLQTKEQDRFKQVGEILTRRVVGQDHVVDAVSKSLKAFRANIKDPRDPGAIFFFTGPTGTGKTELAKAIAELLFDDENAMIRFDMSEFQESHSVAALLGSPPGYVGYEEGGLLVNKVRKSPYSVVLFDEIEKAHPDIYGIFLQMLTDSRLQDKQGRMADFSNVIIIFTSNAGADKIIDAFQKGKAPAPEELKAILRETRKFKDEFLGRVDSNILPFAPITETVARQILDIHFRKFAGILKKQHQVELQGSPELMDRLVEMGFSPLYGARPLKNAIKTLLSPALADQIIMGNIIPGDLVKIHVGEDGNLAWDIQHKDTLHEKGKQIDETPNPV